MRERFRRLVERFIDALTVQERWLVFVILMIVVLGSFVKYCRARPEIISPPSSAVPPPTSFPDDDDR
jgi:hypothetical protein